MIDQIQQAVVDKFAPAQLAKRKLIETLFEVTFKIELFNGKPVVHGRPVKPNSIELNSELAALCLQFSDNLQKLYEQGKI